MDSSISHRRTHKYDGVLGVLVMGLELQMMPELPIEVVVFHDEENTMSGSIGYCLNNQTSKYSWFFVRNKVLSWMFTGWTLVWWLVSWGQRRCSFTIHWWRTSPKPTSKWTWEIFLLIFRNLMVYVSDAKRDVWWSVTVGKLDVSPNAFSVIPGRVDFTLQIRTFMCISMRLSLSREWTLSSIWDAQDHPSSTFWGHRYHQHHSTAVSHSLLIRSSVSLMRSISRLSELWNHLSNGNDLRLQRVCQYATGRNHQWDCVSNFQKF